MAFKLGEAFVEFRHRGLSGVTRAAGAAAASLKRVGVVAGIAAAGGLAVLTRNAFKSIDALAKTSDKLGIGTQELAGLQHAAELTGNSTKQLDVGLQRMVRRVAEAARGSGEAKDAIAELGLDAERLASLSPDQQFARVADAMADVGNQSDRVRLGFKLFDAEGVGLVNTLKLGSEELERLKQEAIDLGKAPTREEAARVEAANDAMLRMRESLEGIGQTVAIAIAPAVEGFADMATTAIAATKPFVELLTNIGVLFGKTTFTVLSTIGGSLNSSIERLTGGVVNLSEIFGNVIGHVQFLADVTRFAADNFGDAFAIAAEFVSVQLQRVGNAFAQVWENAVAFGVGFANNLGPIWETVKTGARLAFEFLKTEFLELANWIVGVFEQAANAIQDALPGGRLREDIAFGRLEVDDRKLNEAIADFFAEFGRIGDFNLPGFDLDKGINFGPLDRMVDDFRNRFNAARAAAEPGPGQDGEEGAGAGGRGKARTLAFEELGRHLLTTTLGSPDIPKKQLEAQQAAAAGIDEMKEAMLGRGINVRGGPAVIG